MSNLILRTTAEGQTMLEEMEKSNKTCQPFLIRIFSKQVGRSNCGIQSCALVLSAAHLGRTIGNLTRSSKELKKYQPFTETSMFDWESTLSVANQEAVNAHGLTLDEVAKILKAHGAQVEKYHAEHSSVEEFTKIAKSALLHCDSSVALIVNYHMKVLGQGEFGGHHSPLGAYHEGSGRFLVLDTWPDTVECWATPDDLFKAMNSIDSSSQRTRGFCVVKISPN